MNIFIDPKDHNTFALSRELGTSSPNFARQSVNYVEFYPGADKPYLVTASDDRTIRI